MGDLNTPRNLKITDIGEDYVLGVFRDEMDVMRIHLHRLLKPSALITFSRPQKEILQ